jgi:hypothetical protein
LAYFILFLQSALIRTCLPLLTACVRSCMHVRTRARSILYVHQQYARAHVHSSGAKLWRRSGAAVSFTCT